MAEIENKNSEKKGSTKRITTNVDMTPMVDLAFLLITFFMLATSLSKPKVMEVNMPSGDKTSPVKHAITLLLGRDNKIYYFYGINEKEAKVSDFKEIRKVLLDFNKSYPNLTVVIKMGDDSKFGNLVDAFDEMVITNSQRYSIGKLTLSDIEIMNTVDPH